MDETIDQLAIAYSMHWHGHVLRGGWSCIEGDDGHALMGRTVMH